jgi:hypothetical protein
MRIKNPKRAIEMLFNQELLLQENVIKIKLLTPSIEKHGKLVSARQDSLAEFSANITKNTVAQILALFPRH